MSTENVTRTQIFTVAACSFTVGIFVQTAVGHLDKGNLWLTLLDVAAVAVNGFAAISLAIRLFRAMPASA
jgi:xanthine/uracil permease